MTENRKVKFKRFPDCSCSEECLHDHDTSKNIQAIMTKKTGKNVFTVAVALAGPASGGITFWGDAKK